MPPVALSIAGSDNSAGAGIQADLKTFTAFGVYGLTAVTCVVAEVPGKVSAIHPVPAPVVAEQIRLSLEAFPLGAIKTGMLNSAETATIVCDLLEAVKIPLVVDPVMVATSGTRLLHEDAIAIYRERLFPRATLVTPNLDEAAVLLGRPVRTIEEMREAGAELTARFGSAWLLKGGHLQGSEALDFLFHADGRVSEFGAPFTRGVSTHGTGCTYSAAIAAGLAQGLELDAAARRAKGYVSAVIAHHHRWGPVHALDHSQAPP